VGYRPPTYRSMKLYKSNEPNTFHYVTLVPSVIDLWSHKFVRQKLNYLHLNPVRAGLCEHPADWKWSSYRSYLPHKPGEVPIEVDWQAYWKDEELVARIGGR
jgi:hypothetical protein